MVTRVGDGDRGARTADLLTEIATRYYLRGESQIEISRALDLAPSTVSRLLRRARADGIVHVEIRPPRRLDADLARTIAELYRVPRVVVARGSAGLDGLASVAADFVDGRLRRGLRLGVSWGRTLAEVVRRLNPGSVSRLSIAQLAGGVDDPHPGIQGHELVAELAERYPGSRVHYLHAPAIVGSFGARMTLLADPSVRSALEAARRCEVALVGIGEMTDGATLVQGRHVSSDDWRTLVAAGAIGNMNTRFFDRDGHPVGTLDDRTIAIEWPDLRRIPEVVAIAGGREKAAAVRAALATGVIDVLVTDEEVAVPLASEPETRPHEGTKPAKNGRAPRAEPEGLEVRDVAS